MVSGRSGEMERVLASHVINGFDGLPTVLAEVVAERCRQDERWGEQNHPNGTGTFHAPEAALARKECEHAAETGQLSWRHILLEEVAEAAAEEEHASLRRELIQVAAVAVAWAEALDRRSVG